MGEERGIGERGPDKKPRDYNKRSLFNLKQFHKPIPNVNPSVNSGVNWSKLGISVVFIIGIGFAIWKIRNRRKKQNETT